MGITATLAGHQATDVRWSIPAWGASYADVALDGEVTLAGAVSLVLADLTLKGTILSGGPAKGRSYFRVVAGAGGWGKTLPKKHYANDLGVKISTVLGDAASACGETIQIGTDDRLGPAWTRPEDIAARVLEQIAPAAWYIGEDGVTRLGSRPATKLTGEVTRTTQVDLARGTVTLASDSIAGILPGLVVDGLTAVDVEHTISAEGGLRSKVWGKRAGSASRRLAALRAIFDQLDPNRMFRGSYEYRVGALSGNRLNLQPVRVSTGMPDMQLVPMWSAGGYKAMPALGSRCVVGFIDADPTRPYVHSFEDPDGAGFVPTSIALAGGGSPVARQGDTVAVYFPSPMAFVGTIGGVAATGNLTPASPGYGVIQTGSAKVSSA